MPNANKPSQQPAIYIKMPTGMFYLTGIYCLRRKPHAIISITESGKLSLDGNPRQLAIDVGRKEIGWQLSRM